MASTSKRARLAFLALLAMPAAVISLTNGIARAHAIVVAAHPAVDSTVAPGELQIRVDFNSRVGWARWLEVEAPERDGRWAGWLWPACFVLIGLLLLDYREA